MSKLEKPKDSKIVKIPKIVIKLPKIPKSTQNVSQATKIDKSFTNSDIPGLYKTGTPQFGRNHEINYAYSTVVPV